MVDFFQLFRNRVFVCRFFFRFFHFSRFRNRERGKLDGYDDEPNYHEDGKQTLPKEIESGFKNSPVHRIKIVECC